MLDVNIFFVKSIAFKIRTMSEDGDWYNKYKSIKKNLEELKKIRVDAVRQDINDISEKISKHAETHQNLMNEISAQKEMIQKQNEKYDRIESECKKLTEAIRKLQFELGRNDSIIRALVSFDFLKVIVQKEGMYAVQIQATCYPTFYLLREKGAIRYIPGDDFPQDFPSWMRAESTITTSQLKSMCSEFEKYFFNDQQDQ